MNSKPTKLQWGSIFETGIEAIDFQHRYFFDLINRIGDAFRSSEDGVYKHNLIIELRKYADFHFISEENIATSLSIPEVDNHHKHHMKFFTELNRKADELENKTISFDDFDTFLMRWLSDHTYNEDQKLFKPYI